MPAPVGRRRKVAPVMASGRAACAALQAGLPGAVEPVPKRAWIGLRALAPAALERLAPRDQTLAAGSTRNTSTRPPVGFVAESLAGITLVSFRTMSDRLRKKRGNSRKKQ